MSDPHDDAAAAAAAPALGPSASADVTVPALDNGPAVGTPTAGDLPLISPVESPSSPLVRIGGALGIAGVVVGLVVLLAGCAGFGGVLVLSYVPVAFGGLGLVLALVGALAHRHRIGEDTHVLQALFATVLSIAGGMLELAVWLKWPILK